jgi:23S rRNA (guanosine2251-2'-O)-methyltransferase
MKTRPQPPQTLWISGINPALEALRSESAAIEEMVLARSDQRGQELREAAKRRRIPVREETRDAVSALVGHGHHQGVGLRAREYVYTPMESLLAGPIEEREPLVLLDCLQDPQNLGAIVRSACFLGAKGIVVPKDRSAGITGTVIKVAAGATSYVPVLQVTNLARAMREFKECGLWMVGLDVEGSQSLYEADLRTPMGLVVGNEQKGLRPLIRKECDLLVRIPAHGPIQSLNAAASCAVALAEIQRQRETR